MSPHPLNPRGYMDISGGTKVTRRHFFVTFTMVYYHIFGFLTMRHCRKICGGGTIVKIIRHNILGMINDGWEAR